MSNDPGVGEILETGAAVLVFAAVFLVRARVHLWQRLLKDPRDLVSFGAGISSAYVFLHVLPAFDVVRRVYVETTPLQIWFHGRGIYLLALLGFLGFYSLHNTSFRLRHAPGGGETARAFRLETAGFAVYLWLMGYLLLHNLQHTPGTILLFAVAIAFHLLGVDHELHRKHGASYERVGRFVLAGAGVLGWLVGLVLAVPMATIAMLVAFVAGAVIMNSAIIELPSGENVRVAPFVSGGSLYGLILLMLH